MLLTKSARAWIAAAMIALSVAGTLRAFALDPQKSINQYGHNVWLRQSGLPANGVNVCLQTHNGYLWLGTSAGLFRFDGVRFGSVSTDPDHGNDCENVSALCESRDSSLWIGTAYSGLRRLKDGKIRLYGPNDGLRERQIRVLFESRAGSLWVGTSNGLFRLVGDNATNRRILTLQAKSWGMIPEPAVSGPEALDLIRQGRRFDLAILDMHMPEMDGLEATRQICNEWPQGRPQIIAMTANASQEDREACLKAGMDGYISKPVHVEELQAVLEQCSKASGA